MLAMPVEALLDGTHSRAAFGDLDDDGAMDLAVLEAQKGGGPGAELDVLLNGRIGTELGRFAAWFTRDGAQVLLFTLADGDLDTLTDLVVDHFNGDNLLDVAASGAWTGNGTPADLATGRIVVIKQRPQPCKTFLTFITPGQVGNAFVTPPLIPVPEFPEGDAYQAAISDNLIPMVERNRRPGDGTPEDCPVDWGSSSVHWEQLTAEGAQLVSASRAAWMLGAALLLPLCVSMGLPVPIVSGRPFPAVYGPTGVTRPDGRATTPQDYWPQSILFTAIPCPPGYMNLGAKVRWELSGLGAGLELLSRAPYSAGSHRAGAFLANEVADQVDRARARMAGAGNCRGNVSVDLIGWSRGGLVTSHALNVLGNTGRDAALWYDATVRTTFIDAFGDMAVADPPRPWVYGGYLTRDARLTRWRNEAGTSFFAAQPAVIDALDRATLIFMGDRLGFPMNTFPAPRCLVNNPAMGQVNPAMTQCLLPNALGMSRPQFALGNYNTLAAAALDEPASAAVMTTMPTTHTTAWAEFLDVRDTNPAQVVRYFGGGVGFPAFSFPQGTLFGQDILVGAGGAPLRGPGNFTDNGWTDIGLNAWYPLDPSCPANTGTPPSQLPNPPQRASMQLAQEYVDDPVFAIMRGIVRNARLVLTDPRVRDYQKDLPVPATGGGNITTEFWDRMAAVAELSFAEGGAWRASRAGPGGITIEGTHEEDLGHTYDPLVDTYAPGTAPDVNDTAAVEQLAAAVAGGLGDSSSDEFYDETTYAAHLAAGSTTTGMAYAQFPADHPETLEVDLGWDSLGSQTLHIALDVSFSSAGGFLDFEMLGPGFSTSTQHFALPVANPRYRPTYRFEVTRSGPADLSQKDTLRLTGQGVLLHRVSARSRGPVFRSDGHAYQLVQVDSGLDWRAALRLASHDVLHFDQASATGHLATIADRAELDFITSTFGAEVRAWVGAEAAAGGNFTWIDGSLVDEALFAASPVVAEARTHAAFIQDGTGRLWHGPPRSVYDRGEAYAYVVEWEPTLAANTFPGPDNISANVGSLAAHLVFENVLVEGVTQATASQEPYVPLPDGAQPLTAFLDITSTAEWQGSIQVTLSVDLSGLSALELGSLALLHETADGWENGTLAFDVAAGTVTARVTQLSQFVVVVPRDVTAPVVAVPALQEVEAASCPVTVPLPAPTVTDDRDAPLSITDDAPALFPAGDTVVTFTATDPWGNAGTAQLIVRVHDVGAPVVSSPMVDIVLEQTTPVGTPFAVPLPAVFDACDDAPVVSHDAPAVFPAGTTTVTFIAGDRAGNTTTVSMQVTVVDGTAPVILSALANPPVLLPPMERDVSVVLSIIAFDAVTPVPACWLDAIDVIGRGDNGHDQSHEENDSTGKDMDRDQGHEDDDREDDDHDNGHPRGEDADEHDDEEARITGALSAVLRAEHPNHRTYVLRGRCADAAGNQTAFAVSLEVRDNGGLAACGAQ
ncbi:MAG: HYR domain-containing protein [Deltaproteobacteria bacterium]|nr:HYR domain-containing protein [Deltaproteobacteria bacterium]